MITENTLRVKIETTGDGQLKASLDGTTQSVTQLDAAQQAQAATAAKATVAQQENAAATAAVGVSAKESAGAVAAAAVASGESIDQQSARIKAMVAASLEQQAANSALAESEASIVERAGLRTEATAAEAAATRASVAAQDAQMVGIKGFVAAEGESTIAVTRDTAAKVANTEAMVINGGVARELGVLTGEGLRGNFTRMEGSTITLANRMGLMSKVFSATGLSIIGTGAALATFGYGAFEAYNNEQQLNAAVAQTGNFAGVTMGRVDGMAESLGTATGKAGMARDILLALAADGKVGAASFDALGQAAFDMATLTGQSAEQAKASVVSLFNGTAAGALKANEQYHFLTDATYDQIKALEEEGKQQEAVQVAAAAFHDAIGPRITEMQNQVYGVAKAWDSVTTSVHGYWEEFKTGSALMLGTADISAQYYAQLGRVQDEIKHFGSPSFGQQEKLDTLKAQFDTATAAAEKTAAQTTLNDQAVQGSAAIDHLAASIDKVDQKKQKLAELSAAFEKLWGSASPDNTRLAGVQRLVGADGSVSFAGGEYDRLKNDINNKYKAPKGPRNPEPAAYTAFSSQVDALDVKTITADSAALTQYEQGIAKLADQMGVYMAKGGDATKAAVLFNRGQQDLYDTLSANRRRELEGEQAYQAALDKTNAALQLQVNNEVARIGQGDKEYQQSQQLAKAYEEEAAALQKLALQRQKGVNGESGGLSKSAYDADVAALRAATTQKIQIMRDGFARMDEAQASWVNGAIRAYENFAASAADVAGQTDHAYSNLFNSMADGVAQFATTGKADFSGMVDSFIADLIRMEARIVESQILESIIGSLAGSYGAAGTNTFSSVGTDASGGSMNYVSHVGGHADGGRITGPGTGTSDSILARVSDGENVITASATDYYGQAFMDALNAKQVPRYAGGGRVGGGSSPGGMGQPAPQIIVNNNSNSQVKASSEQQPDGRWITKMIIDTVASDHASGGKTAKALEGRYGLTRRGIPVGSG